MAKTSPFYFNGNILEKNIRELPIFAINFGANFNAGWHTEVLNSASSFKATAERVNPQVPVFVACPRVVASALLRPGTTLSKLSIDAFPDNRRGDGYMTGTSIAIVLSNVTVGQSQPIFQWKGLPIPPQVQKNHLERKMGRETYIPVAVKLMVQFADVV